MISTRLFTILVVTALVFSGATASAEMTFEPEDVEDEPDDADDDEMTFAPDDLEEDDFDPDAEMDEDIDVGVVAIPGDDITGAERDELQEALREATDEIPEITTYGDSDLLPRLEERGATYCSRESLCLGSVGQDAGVQRIVQARVEFEEDDRADAAGSYRLDIDYFDVDDRLFVAYHSNSGLSDFDDVLEAVGPGVDDIFDIRRDVDDDIYVDDRDVDVGSVVAYSSGGLAAVFLGLGIGFGVHAGGLESDLQEARDEDGDFPGMTQSEAQSLESSMQNSTNVANAFYGLSAGLAILSAGLFVFGGGDGGDEEASVDNSRRIGDVELIPRFGGDHVGIGTRLEF